MIDVAEGPLGIFKLRAILDVFRTKMSPEQRLVL